MLPYGLFIKAL